MAFSYDLDFFPSLATMDTWRVRSVSCLTLLFVGQEVKSYFFFRSDYTLILKTMNTQKKAERNEICFYITDHDDL